MNAPFEIRAPREDEMLAVGKLAADMVRLHHGFDAERFILREPLEPGYANFLAGEVARENSVVLVAASDARGVLGYVFGRLEKQDWMRLVGPHGKIHDVAVDPSSRREGVGLALIRAATARLRALGATKILCDTAYPNDASRRLFERAGFHPTMVEYMLPSANGAGDHS